MLYKFWNGMMLFSIIFYFGLSHATDLSWVNKTAHTAQMHIKK